MIRLLQVSPRNGAGHERVGQALWRLDSGSDANGWETRCMMYLRDKLAMYSPARPKHDHMWYCPSEPTCGPVLARYRVTRPGDSMTIF